MDKTGLMFGELLEKAQIKTSATASDISTSVKSQVNMQGGDNSDNTLPQVDVLQTERTAEMINEFYSSSDSQIPNTTQRNLSEGEQLTRTRNELKKFQNRHNEEYFQPLEQASVSKAPESPNGQQESSKAHELPPLEEPGTKPKRGQPLWVRRKMTQTERVTGATG